MATVYTNGGAVTIAIKTMKHLLDLREKKESPYWWLIIPAFYTFLFGLIYLKLVILN